MEIKDISAWPGWSGGMPARWECSTMAPGLLPSPALPHAPRALSSPGLLAGSGGGDGDLAAGAVLPVILTLLAAAALFSLSHKLAAAALPPPRAGSVAHGL